MHFIYNTLFLGKLQEGCKCNDACESSVFVTEISTASFSQRSVESLLDHGKEDIPTKYRAAREIRERIEPHRLANFLKGFRSITVGIFRFLAFTSYIAAEDETSLRMLSSQMLKVFYEDIVKADLKTLFPADDIKKYITSFETLYQPRRQLINQQLTNVLNEVTLFVDTLSLSIKQCGLENNFNDTRNLAATVLRQIAQANKSVLLLDEENYFISRYFEGSEHLQYKPEHLYDSKAAMDECNKRKMNLIRAMENITLAVDRYLGSDSIQDLHCSNAIGGDPEMDFISVLHSAFLILNDDTTQFGTCLNEYQAFLIGITTFLDRNPFYSEEKSPALPEVTSRIEIEQINLENLQTRLEKLEDQIAQNSRTKLQIAAEMNATLIRQVEAQLETLKVAVTTEVLDKIIDGIESIVDEAATPYESSLTYLVQLQNYLEKSTKSSEFEDRAKQLRLLHEVM